MLTKIPITDPRGWKPEKKTQIAEFYKSLSVKNKALIRMMMMMVKILEADTLTMPTMFNLSRVWPPLPGAEQLFRNCSIPSSLARADEASRNT